MKLTWKQIEPFVKAPNPDARVILVYGPDNGLMRERAKTIGQTIVSDLNDPFNAVTLTSEQLLEDPARLADEAGAISMMGGNRLIRIQDGSDKIAPLIKTYLEEPSADNLVIIEAGELGPKSPLRQLCEKGKNAAAVPCYVEDERGISQVIKDMLREAGFNIQSDAAAWLSGAISGDRLRARGEIEKLITYMGKGPANVTLEDVQNCCGEAGAQGLDDLVYAVGNGKIENALKTFHKLQEEGIADITILRSLQNHFRKLHLVKATIDQGETIDSAIRVLQPPLFFKLEQSFKAQLTRWSLPALTSTLARLSDIEAQSKQTGTPVRTLIAQALLSISKSGHLAKSA
ncbi:MAG: DNA polymerase III subunit delta [Pseudomonadota bacterium]